MKKLFIFYLFLLVFFNRSFVAQQGTLVLPLKNSIQTDSLISFSWNKYLSSDEYQIEIDTTNSFSTPSVFILNSTDTAMYQTYNTYFWRVKYLSQGVLIYTSQIRSFEVFDLNSFGTLSLWLDAGSNVSLSSSEVDSWQSLDASSYVFTPSQITKKPEIIPNTLNGNSSIYFDGTDDLIADLQGDSIHMQTLFTFFHLENAVTNNTIHILGRGCYNCGNPQFCLRLFGNTRINPFATPFNSHYCEGVKAFNSTMGPVLDTIPWAITTQYSTYNQYLPYPNFAISNDVGPLSEAFKGKILEVIAFEEIMSNNALGQKIRDYLRQKYSPEVNLGKDATVSYGFCDTTLTTGNHIVSHLWSDGSTASSLLVSSPGLYWVQATDIFNNVSFDSIYIDYQEPNYPNQLLFCAGDTAVWNANLGSSYSYLWSNNQTTEFINITSPGDYSVEITDINGCNKFSDTLTFVMDNYPNQISLGNDTSFCAGNSISLVAGASATITYNWSNNPANTSSFNSISNSGVYSVITSNSNSCIAKDTINVTIVGVAPTLNYNFPDTVCQLSSFNFADSSFIPSGSGPASIIASISWDLGNGSSAQGISGTHLYIDSGMFLVSLSILTDLGCQSIDSFMVTVHPKPDISYTYNKHCDYDSTVFYPSNQLQDSLVNFAWDFDQSSSGSQNTSNLGFPSHYFGNSGIYDVSLISMDVNGCSDTVIQSVEIFEAPNADFSVPNPCVGGIIDVTNNSSISSPGSIVSYLWDFGDSTNSNLPTPNNKLYDDYGAQVISLVVLSDQNCLDTMTLPIEVNSNPIIDYSIGPSCVNSTTQMISNSMNSYLFDSIVENLWIINVTDSLISDTIGYQFLTSGQQQINLQSTSYAGCITDSVFMHSVLPSVDLSYQIVPPVVVDGMPFQCILNDPSIDSVVWDFGDGNISFDLSPIHTYQSVQDSFNLILTGFNSDGCTDSKTQSLIIYDPFVDLELRQMILSDQNGYYNIVVEAKNIGSVTIESVDLIIHMPNSLTTKETLPNPLLANENIYYPLSVSPSSYVGLDDDVNSFLCIEGVSINNFSLQDFDLSNNWICKNLEFDSLNLVSLYPNPASDNFYAILQIPFESNIDIEIIDSEGRLIKNVYDNQVMMPGTHQLQINIDDLTQGFYFLRISDNRNNVIISRFIK